MNRVRVRWFTFGSLVVHRQAHKQPRAHKEVAAKRQRGRQLYRLLAKHKPIGKRVQ